MPINKKGISANSKFNSNFSSFGLDLESNIQVGRVTDIILNSDYPNINDYGGINGIGTIFFELNKKLTSSKGVAKPFFPQMS